MSDFLTLGIDPGKSGGMAVARAMSDPHVLGIDPGKSGGMAVARAMSDFLTLGIDPGKSGGMALSRADGSAVVAEAFRSELNASVLVRRWKEQYNITKAVMENVHAFPGQGVVSAFSFGENFGFWKGLLAAHGIRVEFVEPRVWQKSLGVRLPGHVQKTAHKNALKSLAAERNPHLKVSLATADAILIASYGARLT